MDLNPLSQGSWGDGENLTPTIMHSDPAQLGLTSDVSSPLQPSASNTVGSGDFTGLSTHQGFSEAHSVKSCTPVPTSL